MEVDRELWKISHSTVFNDTTLLWNFCLDNAIKDGLFLEFGVWQGHSINYLSARLPDIKFYGFDSFEGLPEFWREGYDKGFFKLDQIPALNQNVELFIGMFQDTLIPFLTTRNGTVSFCHIDCDLYSSAIYVLKALKSRFIVGTIILFDEYYSYPGFENGEMKAFCEFINESSIKYEYIGYNASHEQVAVRLTEL